MSRVTASSSTPPASTMTAVVCVSSAEGSAGVMRSRPQALAWSATSWENESLSLIATIDSERTVSF
jgi:hypothetical protein